jgi:YD repeat-containing protein
MAHHVVEFAINRFVATAAQHSRASYRFSAHRWVGAFLFSALCLLAAHAHAALERYDYDALGRVIRYVDPSGRITQYVYDGAGNIVSVRATVPVPAPSVSAIIPVGLRRGASQSFTVTGSNLVNATLALAGAANPELTLSALVVTPTQLTFTLSATTSALTGTQSLSITTPGGVTTTQVNVLPTLPVLTVEPTPLAVPPDSVARDFAVVLSGADSLDHVLTATTDQTAIATVSPTSTSVAAGQTRAVFQIRG